MEIIVEAGGSRDRTREIATELAHFVMIQTSDGVGGAKNDYFRLAKYDLVVTTDADCAPHNNWAESVLNQFISKNVIARALLNFLF